MELFSILSKHINHRKLFLFLLLYEREKNVIFSYIIFKSHMYL
ncbi:hypothetical protein D2M30_0681 [Bacillus amyloliquefaciens]|nr:hypothetical protein D2M30_0681 [Bacillus amyloliquefaciens]